MPRNLVVVRPLLFLTVLALIAPSSAPASDKGTNEGEPDALSETRFITLVLDEGEESFEFSTAVAVAGRPFSLTPLHHRLNLRAQFLVQKDGRELLDYSIEYQRFVETGGHRDLRTGNWSGSAYVEDGEAIEIARGPNYSFSVKIESRRKR